MYIGPHCCDFVRGPPGAPVPVAVFTPLELQLDQEPQFTGHGPVIVSRPLCGIVTVQVIVFMFVESLKGSH